MQTYSTFHSCAFKYAAETIEQPRAAGKLTRQSQFPNWKDLSACELQGFHAVVLNMGIIKVPEIEDYWKTSWISEIPFFRRVMSRDRFEQIFWMLHVSHSETPNSPKEIGKVKLLLEQLLAKYQSNYLPG